MQRLATLLLLIAGQAEAAFLSRQGSEPNIAACAGKDGKYPSPFGEDGKGKFDLIITWWNGAKQPPLSLLQTGSKTNSKMRIEGQSEIKYLLRSYEKFGLLDHVRDLVLLIDSNVIKKFGRPRFFDYSNKHVRVVTDEDLGLDNNGTIGTDGNEWYGKWSKALSMHKIPGISDYFLYTPDDTYLVSKFDPKHHFFNAESGKPVIYDYGDYTIGWCDNMMGLGTGHGPIMVDKCAMGAIADYYKDKGWLTGGVTKGKKIMDATCLYSNWMVKSGWEEVRYGSPAFHSADGSNVKSRYLECHTNGGCDANDLDTLQTQLTFLNVQGWGVSDEYEHEFGKHPKDEEVFKKYLHKNFVTPSRFEVKGA